MNLNLAWDALAYERYEPGSSKEATTAFFLFNRYVNTKSPIVDLNSEQTRLIDAMAEAAGIPRQRGQPVAMPEYLKNQPQWVLSLEYQARVAAARAKRGK